MMVFMGYVGFWSRRRLFLQRRVGLDAVSSRSYQTLCDAHLVSPLLSACWPCYWAEGPYGKPCDVGGGCVGCHSCYRHRRILIKPQPTSLRTLRWISNGCLAARHFKLLFIIWCTIYDNSAMIPLPSSMMFPELEQESPPPFFCNTHFLWPSKVQFMM